MEKRNVDQIDIVSEINRLDIKEDNDFIKEENVSDFNIDSEEIKSIFEKKPNNQFTQPKPQSFLNRVSSFFVKDKAREMKLDPNLKLQNDIISEKEYDKTDKKLNFEPFDKKTQKGHENEIQLNLNQKDEVSENMINNLDLFENENQSTSNNHQIDLTDIEQENNDIDEKVLEIPAFLRRQAN